VAFDRDPNGSFRIFKVGTSVSTLSNEKGTVVKIAAKIHVKINTKIVKFYSYELEIIT